MQDFFKGCIYFYASFQIQMRWATPDSITGFWIGNGYFSYIFFLLLFLTLTFLFWETSILSTGSKNWFCFTSSSIRFLSKVIVVLWCSEYPNFCWLAGSLKYRYLPWYQNWLHVYSFWLNTCKVLACRNWSLH